VITPQISTSNNSNNSLLQLNPNKPAANISICAIGADEYRPSAFVILINFSNLAVSTQKLSRTDPFGTAKRATGTQTSKPSQSPGR